MAEEQGVTPAESPTEGKQADVNVQSSSTDVAASSAESSRNIENMFRELQRKDAEKQRQIDAVLAWIGTQGQQQQVQQPVKNTQEISDEDLWALVQQGDRAAYDLYTQRQYQRHYTQSQQQTNAAQMVQGQLQYLTQKYPQLRDNSNPLTQHANQIYMALLQRGYPAHQGTLLEAAKTAIADRPDLALEGAQMPQNQQTPVARQQRYQSGQTGGSVRQGSNSPAQNQPKPLTAEELAIAKRMGVKDPKGSKGRFLKRNEDGQSALGAVGGFPAVIQQMENL